MRDVAAGARLAERRARDRRGRQRLVRRQRGRRRTAPPRGPRRTQPHQPRLPGQQHGAARPGRRPLRRPRQQRRLRRAGLARRRWSTRSTPTPTSARSTARCCSTPASWISAWRVPSVRAGRRDHRRLGVRISGLRVDGEERWRSALVLDGGWGPEPTSTGGVAEWTQSWARMAVPVVVRRGPRPRSGPGDPSGPWAVDVELSAAVTHRVRLDGGAGAVEVEVTPTPAWYRLEVTGEPYEVVNNAGNDLRADGYGLDRGFGVLRSDWPDEPAEIFGWCGGAVLLRPSYLEQVGLFEESFFLYYEDVDLSWRGRARGWRYAYVPSAVAHHVHAASGGVASALAMRYAERNRLVTLVRNAPARLATVAVLRFVTATASYALRGPGPGDGSAPGPIARRRLGALGLFLRALPGRAGPAAAAPGPPTGARRGPHGLAGARSILLTAGTLGWPCPLPVRPRCWCSRPTPWGRRWPVRASAATSWPACWRPRARSTLASPVPRRPGAARRRSPRPSPTAASSASSSGRPTSCVAMASLLHEHRWIGQATGAGGTAPGGRGRCLRPGAVRGAGLSPAPASTRRWRVAEALARMIDAARAGRPRAVRVDRQRHLLIGMMAGLGRVNVAHLRGRPHLRALRGRRPLRAARRSRPTPTVDARSGRPTGRSTRTTSWCCGAAGSTSGSTR